MYGGLRRRVVHRRPAMHSRGAGWFSNLASLAMKHGPSLVNAALTHGPALLGALSGQGRRRTVHRRGGLSAAGHLFGRHGPHIPSAIFGLGRRRMVHRASGVRRAPRRRGGVLSGGRLSHAARSEAARLGWARRRRHGLA